MARILTLLLAVLVVRQVAGGDAPALPKGVPLPIDKAKVHQAVEPGQGVFARLARGGVVVAKVAPDIRALAVSYALGAAPEPSVFQLPKFKAASTAYLLTVGPQLDSPDTVTVKSLTQSGEEIELIIEHTQKGLEGGGLRRNIPTRPMVEVPLELAPGTYRLTVIWKAVPGLPAGKPFTLDPVTHVCSFTVER